MNKLKASVIVPTYNRKKLLNYTLESLSKQTMNKEEYEIIICDDGSNDNTFELIRKYEKMMNIAQFKKIVALSNLIQRIYHNDIRNMLP